MKSCIIENLQPKSVAVRHTYCAVCSLEDSHRVKLSVCKFKILQAAQWLAYLVAPSLSTKQAGSFGEWVIFGVWAALFWWGFCVTETVVGKVRHPTLIIDMKSGSFWAAPFVATGLAR